MFLKSNKDSRLRRMKGSERDRSFKWTLKRFISAKQQRLKIWGKEFFFHFFDDKILLSLERGWDGKGRKKTVASWKMLQDWINFALGWRDGVKFASAFLLSSFSSKANPWDIFLRGVATDLQVFSHWSACSVILLNFLLSKIFIFCAGVKFVLGFEE
jgi:hypothetical protein